MAAVQHERAIVPRRERDVKSVKDSPRTAGDHREQQQPADTQYLKGRAEHHGLALRLVTQAPRLGVVEITDKDGYGLLIFLTSEARAPNQPLTGWRAATPS
jgi:hypothetical protein